MREDCRRFVAIANRTNGQMQHNLKLTPREKIGTSDFPLTFRSFWLESILFKMLRFLNKIYV
jgi:hypothetical protein